MNDLIQGYMFKADGQLLNDVYGPELGLEGAYSHADHGFQGSKVEVMAVVPQSFKTKERATYLIRQEVSCNGESCGANISVGDWQDVKRLGSPSVPVRGLDLCETVSVEKILPLEKIMEKAD